MSIEMEECQGEMLGDLQQPYNPSGFLSLPLELRQVIYRHLLIPNPIVTMKRKTYGIETAIVLVNKQIYEQASWVLYRDNYWVLLRINAPFRTFLEGWRLEDDLQRYPIVPLAERSFTREPCLEFNVRKMGPEVRDTARDDLRKFIVSLDGLPHVCQILTAAENISEFEIVVKFADMKASTLDRIMDCLEEACGFGNVSVDGLDAAATKQATTKLIMPGYITREGKLERTNGHEARITKEIADCRYIQAMKACQDGMAYIEFACKISHHWRLESIFQMLPTLRSFTKMALKHAWCCLECGDHQSTRHIMSLFLGSDRHTSFYRGDLSLCSEGHFYYGLSLVAGGADNAAVFSFFRALAMTDNPEKADKALDAIEARIALHDSNTETIRIGRNLQNFKIWRHRKVQDVRVTAAERSRLLLEFSMSDKEMYPLWIREGAFLSDKGQEVFIDTLDSIPSRNSAFVFGEGVQVLRDEA